MGIIPWSCLIQQAYSRKQPDYNEINMEGVLWSLNFDLTETNETEPAGGGGVGEKKVTQKARDGRNAKPRTTVGLMG